MDFETVVRVRRMVRAFTDEPVPPEVVARILDLARHAPSAGYTQGQSFVTVTRPDRVPRWAPCCRELPSATRC